MIIRHECEREEDNAEIYYGEVPVVKEAITWWLHLKVEWCPINFCPFCGAKLEPPQMIDQTKRTICNCHLPQVWGHEKDCPEYNQDGTKK